MGLGPNYFFTKLGNFSEPQFLQPENLPIAILRVVIGGLHKVRCVRGHSSRNFGAQ